MKQQYQYFNAKSIKNDNTLEFESIKDFHRFMELHHQKSVFLINADKQATHFALLHNGGLLQQPTGGYKTLEDYFTATENGFPDSQNYYEAEAKGYKRYDEYKLVKEAGINSKEEFDKVKAGGYIDGFNEMVKKETEGGAHVSFENPYRLYEHASSKGFTSYRHYAEATGRGFADAMKYALAKEKNFETAADYEDAIKRGFTLGVELKLARELQIRDRDDFQKFNDLKFVQVPAGCSVDESVMLVLLSRLPDDKKVSVSKLSELFEKAKEEYRYPDTGEMPKWFVTTLNDRSAIINFFSGNESIKRYGHYDKDGEYFETAKMRERNVVIDGSNVAHNSKGNAESKPSISNIIKLTNELKRIGFTGITVIVDAALKHRLADAEKIKELKEMVDYLEAPAENPADIFIIQYVKRNHCLLVSNDTFREWKTNDPWVAENIDFYRMSFMINGDSVLLPDMKGK